MPPASPDIHHEVDVSALAAALGITVACLCAGLGLDEQLAACRPAATASQQVLRPVARVLDILIEIFRDPESVRAWLRTPHPDLDGRTALETILDHQAQAVCTILESALAGVPI